MNYLASSATVNLSLYAIPAAYVLAIWPHTQAIALSKASKDLPEFDNSSPREFIKKVSSLEKQSDDAKKYLRAEAAQQNGFENLPVFIGALLAGNLAHLAPSTLNAFAAFYLASRVAYNLLYINVTNQALSFLRSASFLAGVVSLMTLFVKSGNALNKF